MDEPEPVPILTSSSDDESVDGGMTGSDADELDATSDYGSGEQQPVSDRSEEGSDGNEEDGEEDASSASWETEEDGDGEDGDHGERGEVMEDAFATQDSDEVREEGNALFKEKKVRRFSYDFKCNHMFSTRRLLRNTRLQQRSARDAKLVWTVVGRGWSKPTG